MATGRNNRSKSNKKCKILSDKVLAVDPEFVEEGEDVQVCEAILGSRSFPPRNTTVNSLIVLFTAKLEALKSKEDLDKELEQYMIDTKSILDHGSNSRNCD